MIGYQPRLAHCSHSDSFLSVCQLCGLYLPAQAVPLKTIRFVVQRLPLLSLKNKFSKQQPTKQLPSRLLPLRLSVIDFMSIMRKKLKFDLLVLSKAIILMDGFLGQSQQRWTKAYFYGVVCLNLSAKLSSVNSQVLDWSQIRMVSSLNEVQLRQFVDAQKQILQHFQYRVNPQCLDQAVSMLLVGGIVFKQDQVFEKKCSISSMEIKDVELLVRNFQDIMKDVQQKLLLTTSFSSMNCLKLASALALWIRKKLKFAETWNISLTQLTGLNSKDFQKEFSFVEQQLNQNPILQTRQNNRPKAFSNDRGERSQRPKQQKLRMNSYFRLHKDEQNKSNQVPGQRAPLKRKYEYLSQTAQFR